MVDVIAPVNHIDGGVHFDAGDLRAAQLHHVVDMVDVIVLDDGEYAAHPSDDSSLFTMVNIAAADDVAAHLLLQPSVILTAADSIPLHLGGAFQMLFCKVVVIVRIQIFSQRNTGTFAVADFTVFDDPAFGPVRADHTVLVSGGRRPGGGRLGDEKSADGYVTDAGPGGHETFPADIDLHLLLIGIFPLEIGVDDGLAAFLAGIPLEDGSLRLPRAVVDLAADTLLQRVRLIQHPVVEVHCAGVPAASGKVPVSVHIGGVGVIISENGVVNPADPYGALIRLPVFHFLRAGDHRSQRRRAAVGDPGVFGSGISGIHIFPVNTGRHQNFIAGPGRLGGIVDTAKRHLAGTVSAAARILVDIDLHVRVLLIVFL